MAEVTEGGGERMNPPDWAGGVDMAVFADLNLESCSDSNASSAKEYRECFARYCVSES